MNGPRTRVQFGWRPGLALDVDYVRQVRQADGSARFAHRWRWSVEEIGAELRIAVGRHELVGWDDDRGSRTPEAVDLLRDWPTTIRARSDGSFAGIEPVVDLPVPLGLTEDRLTALPSAEAWLVASAANLWSALVTMHAGATDLPLAAPRVIPTPDAPLPLVGARVPWLLTVAAAPLVDGTVEITWRNEPDPDAVTAALHVFAAAHPLDVASLEVVTEGRLCTDAGTLVPRELELIAARRITRRRGGRTEVDAQHELRRWRFVELPS